MFDTKRNSNQFLVDGAWCEEISINGKGCAVLGFESILKGRIIMLIIQFIDTQHHLILATKINEFNKKDFFEFRGLYLTGELTGDHVQDKIRAEGTLYAIKTEGKQHFKITGTLNSEFNELCKISLNVASKEMVV